MPMPINNLKRSVFMLSTGLLMGALFSFQSKSVSQANMYFNRESRINIFKEIEIFKQGNQNLSEQVSELQKELANSSDKEQALNSIKKEIDKYELLSGQKSVKGPGISVQISGELESLWFTDMVNELFSAGAEAISINGMRLGGDRSGFDTMPNGQILFGGEILTPPFKIEAIGDSKTLAGSLNQAGGIISRISAYKPEYKIGLKEETNLQLNPVVPL
jgi:uncharacterized protein YlxW (UPF0749 family)